MAEFKGYTPRLEILDEVDGKRKPKRSELKAKRKAAAEELQNWLTERKEAAKAAIKADTEKRRAARADKEAAHPEYVDHGRATYKPVVEHEGLNHQTRRTMARFTVDRRPERVPREGKSRGTKGPARKIKILPGINTPYVNPERDAKRAERRARRAG